MKSSNKIIITSLIIGVVSIAGTAMAAPKHPKPEKPVPPQTVIINNNYGEKIPPKHDGRQWSKLDEFSNRRRIPEKPWRSGWRERHDETPPPPPPHHKDHHKEHNHDRERFVKIIIDNLF